MRFAVLQRDDSARVQVDGGSSSAYHVLIYNDKGSRTNFHGILEKCSSDKNPYDIQDDKVEIYKGLVTMYDDFESENEDEEPFGLIVETLERIAVVKRSKFHCFKVR